MTQQVKAAGVTPPPPHASGGLRLRQSALRPCFINELAEPRGSSSVVQAVVNIASARNMTTTVEGVETEAQRELLRTLGCTEMQGWLFSPARPAAEVRRLLLGRGGMGAVA